MKVIQLMKIPFAVVLVGGALISIGASAEEMTPDANALLEGPGYPTDYFNATTGEIRNPVVLNQRLQERRLDTSLGVVDVPYSAEIVDSRPVDGWYERKAAKATLIFRNDRMIRVEITE